MIRLKNDFLKLHFGRSKKRTGVPRIGKLTVVVLWLLISVKKSWQTQKVNVIRIESDGEKTQVGVYHRVGSNISIDLLHGDVYL